MPLPPTIYRPTDYPPPYRPIGYWAHETPPPDAPPDDTARGWSRGRRWLLAAALALTLVLHAGIAWAMSDGDASAGARRTQGQEESTQESCDTATEEELMEEETDVGDSDAGNTPQQSDPSRAPL